MEKERKLVIMERDKFARWMNQSWLEKLAESIPELSKESKIKTGNRIWFQISVPPIFIN